MKIKNLSLIIFSVCLTAIGCKKVASDYGDGMYIRQGGVYGAVIYNIDGDYVRI